MKKVNFPFCSIIVLNYFGEKIIKKCLDLLLELDYPKNKYEIIVVDNNSTDQSRTIINRLAENNKIIKEIYLNKNFGFSKGNNVGIKAARGKYVALLNNDCFVDKNWLKELVKVAEEDKNIFAVASKILITDNFKNPTKSKIKLIQNAGSIIFQDGYGRDIGTVINYDHEQSYEEDYGQYDQKREVYSVCGAACLLRKNVLKKLEYLDESFFFYYEDTEISERARFAGYKLIYTPKATAYHLHAYSSSEWSPFFIYHSEKGRLLHVFYNFPLTVFIREYFKFTAESFGRLLGIRGLGSLVRIPKLLFYTIFIVPAVYKIFNPNKKFIKKFKSNAQYLKASFYFLLNLPQLFIYRWQKRSEVDKKIIWKNYQDIVTGRWYLN